MSEVTNLILSFSNVEDEKSRIYEVNLFFNNGRGFQIESADFEEGEDRFGKKNKKRWYGGSKFLETPLYIGAFNHLDFDGLKDHLRDIEWEQPESVQLIVKGPDSNIFEIIAIK